MDIVGGSRPRDVMEFLGDEGKNLVVWRAGCWGEKGVESIETGAFQSISAHIAVDGVGGKFWQTIVAEQCVQGACGARSKIEVKSNGDISLEYCDEEDDDSDCVVSRSGHRIRHVRLDCDIKLLDEPLKAFVGKGVKVRSDEERKDELSTQSQAAKTPRARISVQNTTSL